MNLLIKGGRVIDPGIGLDGAQDVLIQDGTIARLGKGLKVPDGCPVYDAAGKVVAPGFIDMHVHLREPGYEYKETVVTGTRAAAAGGFTSVACMANTLPVNDTRAVTDYILAKAREEGVVRVFPIGAVTKGLQGEELAEMGELAQAGCVAFSDDGRPVMNSGLLRRAMEYAQIFGLPIISHAEDSHLASGGVMHEGIVSMELGLRAIPGAAEEVMVSRDILLSELSGTPVHIAHVSTAGSVRLIREGKARGVRVTAEVTPHHLLLTDDSVRGFDANTKVNPPLRTKADIEALIQGLRDGTIDAVATDHAPHALAEKEVEYDLASFGIVGLETAVPLLLTHLVNPGLLDLGTFIARLTGGPAGILSLPRGRLTQGMGGDVTILDLAREWTVEPSRFQSKGRNSPFGGWRCTGGPVATIVGGRVVWEAGGK